MSRGAEMPRLVNFSDSDMSTDSDEESREGSSACNVIPGNGSSPHTIPPRVHNYHPHVQNPQTFSTEISPGQSKYPDPYSYQGRSKDCDPDNNQLNNRGKSQETTESSSIKKFDSKDKEKEDKLEISSSRNKRSNSRSRRSRSGGRRRSSSRNRSRSRSESSRSRSRSRSRERSRSRSRSTGRQRSKSWSRRRSNSRGRRSRSRSRRSRSRSRDRRRRSRSGSRGRYRRRSRSRSRGRYRRSRSGGRRRRSPYRRRISPPRAHKTLDTLEKLGIELKPPAPPAEEPEPYIPPYYNRLAVNPTKYAQQIAKRKLIWGNKNTEEATKSTSWQGATFSQDQDGKMTAKFKRLMGIKQDEQATSSDDKGQDLIKRQQELFSSMEMQYEAARQATHTQRGVGLGFSSHPHHFPPT